MAQSNRGDTFAKGTMSGKNIFLVQEMSITEEKRGNHEEKQKKIKKVIPSRMGLTQSNE